MAEDVEGSSGVVVDGLDGVGHDGEEFQFGWNEDKIDLEFKTDDLTSLLAEKNSLLDNQLFKQTDQLDTILRKELKDINQSISGGNSSTADQIWSQNTEATAIKTEETLQDLSTEVVVFFQTFESFPTEDSFIEDDVNNSNNSNIYISLLISIILLLFLTAIILILLKCRVFKRRTTDSDLPLHSARLQSRLSGEDNSRFVVNIKNAQHGRTPKYTVVEMTGSDTANQHQVSIIGSSISKIKNHSHSSFFQGQEVFPTSPTSSPVFSCMPAINHPSLDRTSPEGRSCDDADQDVVVRLEEEQEQDIVCQAEEEEKFDLKDLATRAVEEMTSISSNCNFRTPTSQLSQSNTSHQDDNKADMFGEISLKYIDCEDMEEIRDERGEETSVSSFSTFYTPTSPEGGSLEDREITRDLSREIAENIDLGQELCKQMSFETDTEEQFKERRTDTRMNEVFTVGEEQPVDITSPCSYHSTVSHLNLDKTNSYESSSSGDGQIHFTRHVHQAQVEQACDTSLSSFCSFRTPLSNLSLDKTISCSDEDHNNCTLKQSQHNIDDDKSSRIDKSADKGSLSSFYSIYSPASDLSMDRNSFEVASYEAEEDSIGDLKDYHTGCSGLQAVTQHLVNSTSASKVGRITSSQDKTGSTSSLSQICQDESWMEQEVFSETKEIGDGEDADIISSFSTFNNLMNQLSLDSKMSDVSCSGSPDRKKEMMEMEPSVPHSSLLLEGEYDGKIKDTDEKTSSEDSSYSGTTQSVYVRLCSEDKDPHGQDRSAASGEGEDSPVQYSTTPLLTSVSHSPESCSSGDGSGLKVEIKLDDGDNLIELAWDSGSEEEIDITAFKQLILSNAGEESSNQPHCQKKKSTRGDEKKPSPIVKSDSEFLI